MRGHRAQAQDRFSRAWLDLIVRNMPAIMPDSCNILFEAASGAWHIDDHMKESLEPERMLDFPGLILALLLPPKIKRLVCILRDAVEGHHNPPFLLHLV